MTKEYAAPIFITGEAYWAKVFEPNTINPEKPEYTIDICNLDPDNLKIAQDAGLSVKNVTAQKPEDKRGDFVTLKQFTTNYSGAHREIRVVDAQRNAFPSNTLIGNGSKVCAKAFAKAWTFGGKEGVKGYLDSLQVRELVEYASSGPDFDVVPDGYTNGDEINRNEAVDFPLAS
jgi:hypothetical protein